MKTVPSQTSRISTSAGSVGRIASISAVSRSPTSISFAPGSGQDAEIDALPLAVLGHQPRLFGAQLHPGDVGAAPLRHPLGYDQRGELLRGPEVGVREQVDLHLVALGAADRREVVVPLERGVDAAGREADGGEALWIDPDPHRDRAAARCC
ncbi:MAG: hypothetical protein R2909_18015 [Gemmatimonadales bacterium]